MKYHEREVKRYDLGNGWGIDCITHIDFGEKSYEINVVMLCVPWEEVVHSIKKIKDPAEANQKFKELVERYKKL